MSKEPLQHALDALRIANDFCNSFTADDCPDTVANPIRDAFKLLESVVALAQPEQPCRGCNGHGEVGGLRSDGYDSEICPFCKGRGTEQIAQPAPVAQAEPLSDGHIADLYLNASDSFDFARKVETAHAIKPPIGAQE